MKIRIIISLLAVLLITSGCLAEIKGHNLSVQKRIGEDDTYENYKEITQRKQVQNAMKIVNEAKWEPLKIEMIEYADYKFQFPFKNDKENKIASYSMWLSKDDARLEIISSSDKYVKLSKQDSIELHSILTGDETID